MMTAVMALLLMAGTSAFAQENKSVAPPRERPTTEQLARKATDRMTAQLKLTEKQAEQRKGQGDGNTYNVTVNASGRKLLDIIISEAEMRRNRNGKNPFELA